MTKEILISLVVLLMCGVACADSCEPENNSRCFRFEGKSDASYQNTKAPQGYFPAGKFKIKAWLSGGSPGTWRFKLMKWSKVRADEQHNHFHAVAGSDFSVSGPNQELVYENKDQFALFAFHVTCEDDCVDKPFTLHVQEEVSMNVNQQECVRNTPTLGVLPGFQDKKAGEEAQIDIYIKNNDSRECGSSIFLLDALPQDGVDVVDLESFVEAEPGKLMAIPLKLKVSERALPKQRLVKVLLEDLKGLPEHKRKPTHAVINVIE